MIKITEKVGNIVDKQQTAARNLLKVENTSTCVRTTAVFKFFYKISLTFH
jgi:hypothetical protein